MAPNVNIAPIKVDLEYPSGTLKRDELTGGGDVPQGLNDAQRAGLRYCITNSLQITNPEPTRLPYTGTECYRNAALTVLLHLTPFRNFVSYLRSQGGFPTWDHLYELTTAYWDTSLSRKQRETDVKTHTEGWFKPINTEPYQDFDSKLPGGKSFDEESPDQADPLDFIQYVLARTVRSELSADEAVVLQRLFQHSYLQRYAYECECHEKIRQRPKQGETLFSFWTFELGQELSKENTLADLLVAHQLFEQNPTRRGTCPTCGQSDLSFGEYSKLTYFPEVLTIGLGSQEPTKVSSDMEIPEFLDFSALLDQPESGETALSGEDVKQTGVYQLHAVIGRFGFCTNDSSLGHYDAHIRRGVRNWVRVDPLKRSGPGTPTEKLELGSMSPRGLFYVQVHKGMDDLLALSQGVASTTNPNVPSGLEAIDTCSEAAPAKKPPAKIKLKMPISTIGSPTAIVATTSQVQPPLSIETQPTAAAIPQIENLDTSGWNATQWKELFGQLGLSQSRINNKNAGEFQKKFDDYKDADDDKRLEFFKREMLVEIAKNENIPVGKGAGMPELKKAIRAHRKANAPAPATAKKLTKNKSNVTKSQQAVSTDTTDKPPTPAQAKEPQKSQKTKDKSQKAVEQVTKVATDTTKSQQAIPIGTTDVISAPAQKAARKSGKANAKAPKTAQSIAEVAIDTTTSQQTVPITAPSALPVPGKTPVTRAQRKETAKSKNIASEETDNDRGVNKSQKTLKTAAAADASSVPTQKPNDNPKKKQDKAEDLRKENRELRKQNKENAEEIDRLLKKVEIMKNQARERDQSNVDLARENSQLKAQTREARKLESHVSQQELHIARLRRALTNANNKLSAATSMTNLANADRAGTNIAATNNLGGQPKLTVVNRAENTQLDKADTVPKIPQVSTTTGPRILKVTTTDVDDNVETGARKCYSKYISLPAYVADRHLKTKAWIQIIDGSSSPHTPKKLRIYVIIENQTGGIEDTYTWVIEQGLVNTSVPRPRLVVELLDSSAAEDPTIRERLDRGITTITGNIVAPTDGESQSQQLQPQQSSRSPSIVIVDSQGLPVTTSGHAVSPAAQTPKIKSESSSPIPTIECEPRIQIAPVEVVPTEGDIQLREVSRETSIGDGYMIVNISVHAQERQKGHGSHTQRVTIPLPNYTPLYPTVSDISVQVHSDNDVPIYVHHYLGSVSTNPQQTNLRSIFWPPLATHSSSPEQRQQIADGREDDDETRGTPPPHGTKRIRDEVETTEAQQPPAAKRVREENQDAGSPEPHGTKRTREDDEVSSSISSSFEEHEAKRLRSLGIAVSPVDNYAFASPPLAPLHQSNGDQQQHTAPQPVTPVQRTTTTTEARGSAGHTPHPQMNLLDSRFYNSSEESISFPAHTEAIENRFHSISDPYCETPSKLTTDQLIRLFSSTSSRSAPGYLQSPTPVDMRNLLGKLPNYAAVPVVPDTTTSAANAQVYATALDTTGRLAVADEDEGVEEMEDEGTDGHLTDDGEECDSLFGDEDEDDDIDSV